MIDKTEMQGIGRLNIVEDSGKYSQKGLNSQ